MVKYIKAQTGNMFVLTELGKTNNKVNAKYNPEHGARYKYTVPDSWVRDGYVIEVKENK